MSALQVLEGARRRLETGWVQGFFAADENGDGVDVNSPLACRWCSGGAIRVESDEDGVYYAARCLLTTAIESISIADWNDEPGRTKEEVLEAFDKAIALAKERE